MRKAHNTMGLLHRDVSIGNIMIDQSGRGILNDWDHAGRHDPSARGIVSPMNHMAEYLINSPESGYLGVSVHTSSRGSRQGEYHSGRARIDLLGPCLHHRQALLSTQDNVSLRNISHGSFLRREFRP